MNAKSFLNAKISWHPWDKAYLLMTCNYTQGVTFELRLKGQVGDPGQLREERGSQAEGTACAKACTGSAGVHSSPKRRPLWPEELGQGGN